VRQNFNLGLAILLAAVTVAVYWPVGGFEFTIYDDPSDVYENPYVLGGLTWHGIAWALTATEDANWMPLTRLSHMAVAHVAGMSAGRHHQVNLALHVANVVLLFLVLAWMTGARWPSAAVAALFALHPLHVESVAWVTERKDVLSTLFWILTMGAYAWYARRPSVVRYAAVFGLLALGLMAKPMLVTLPLVLLLLDFWPLGRLTGNAECGMRSGGLTAKAERSAFSLRTAHSALRVVLEKVPLLALAAAASVLTYVTQQAGGAMRFGHAISFSSRVSSALVAYVAYLGQTVWPQGLTVYYPYVADRPVWQPVAAAVFLTVVTVVVVVAARRVALGYLAVGWFWYVGTLVPVIGLVQVGRQWIADRYTYVPLIGVFLMVSWGAWEACHAFAPLRKHGRFLLAVGSAAVLAALAVAARIQARYWADNETLFHRNLAVIRGSALAHFHLGAGMLGEGRFSEAATHLAEAIRLDPADLASYSGLGYVLHMQGRLDEAVAVYRQALSLKPDDAMTYSNLGVILEAQGRRDEAMAHYREAVRLDPDNAGGHDNLAGLLLSFGRLDEAIAHYRRAATLRPDRADVHRSLGVALLRKGDFGGAVGPLAEVVRLRPDDAKAHNNLGFALVSAGRAEEGIACFREAVRMDAFLPDAQKNLGWVLAAQGRTAEAAPHLAEALRLRPDWGDMADQLARIRAADPDAALRNGAEAVALAERACALTGRQNPAYLDTLAAAYAEAGRFADAVAAAREASALAARQGQRDLAARIDARRLAYEAGRPVRRGAEPPAPTSEPRP